MAVTDIRVGLLTPGFVAPLISALYVGTLDVGEVYLGSNLVYQP
tara:strand:+ start:134 stop:265 length:132 start_codon:yes stop_codon:yes gene_type:complete